MRSRPNVVLLDPMLLGKGGLEVCREIRTRSDVPILIGDRARRRSSLELPAGARVIAKPVDVLALRALVEG